MVPHRENCTCALCGRITAILDFGYQLPDCVWEQPASARSPKNSSDFAELGDRYFVRGLLPVKLENGEEFQFGVWLEVERETFDDVKASWNDDVRYPKLKFAAKIANAAPPWGTKLLGANVDVGVRDRRARPFVVAAGEEWLEKVIERGWSAAEYEAVVASLTDRA